MTHPNVRAPSVDWPVLRPLGLDGLLVSFAGQLAEDANRAALAFRAHVDAQALDAVAETSTSLVSVYVRFDPLHPDAAGLPARLAAFLAARNWFAAPMPKGRKLWHIPASFGPEYAPQLAEAAAAAGQTAQQAVAALTGANLRVQTIGFAPGQPYLGQLPPVWDIPRQTGLTAQVPVGALAVAVRQMVLFSASTPTGWRHVGQTAMRLFRPETAQPFVLQPGDEVRFHAVSGAEFSGLATGGPDGGARWEALA